MPSSRPRRGGPGGQAANSASGLFSSLTAFILLQRKLVASKMLYFAQSSKPFGEALMKAMLFAVLALVPVQLFAADALTYDQQEAFLKTAKITAAKGSKKGVTGTVRVTMTDGKITHDASVQRIDEYQAVFQAADGKTEMNFKDTYKFNIAGWRLAKMLGIEDMVPPSV